MIIGVNLLTFYPLFRYLSSGKPKQHRLAIAVSTVVAAAILVLTALMFIIRLETEVGERGVHVRFYPIDAAKRFYPWGSISSARVRLYDATGEYSGWGIKGTPDNRALNITGDAGLQLLLKNDKRVLIGTQKPDELTIALKKAGY